MILRLMVGMALAAAMVLGMGGEVVETKPPCGKGKQPPCGGGGGGGGGATQLIIDFRDDPGDLLRSDDGGAYISGGTDIDRAEFDDAGEVRLSFVQKKGKNPPPPSRQLRVDLRAAPDPDWGGEPPDFLVDGSAPADLNGFFHISADADPGRRPLRLTMSAISGSESPCRRGFRSSASANQTGRGGSYPLAITACETLSQPSTTG